ncbi:MAG: hypothetical protein IPK80_03010 [Nannocystis sp.]|nr:hypothetical protein [Nannocystis sp.]
MDGAAAALQGDVVGHGAEDSSAQKAQAQAAGTGAQLHALLGAQRSATTGVDHQRRAGDQQGAGDHPGGHGCAGVEQGLAVEIGLGLGILAVGVAAAGLVLVMLGAAGTHVALGEAAMMAPSLILGGISAFIAWGRGVKAPIAPRA